VSGASKDAFLKSLCAQRNLRHALFAAVAVIVILFPDVLFLRAGLSQTSQFMGTMDKRPAAVFYPQPPWRNYHHAYADNGGALWQSEPAQQFLSNCLRSGESPYWNPYSGAGQLGPETLVDLKFSFQALLMAICGGSQTAFNIIIIGSFFTAILFLHLFCTRFLGLSQVASTGASFIYALNGYSTATQGSNTSQTYLYFPALIYALTAFASKPSAIKFVWLVLIDAIILSTTFLPTTFLALLTTHVIALALAASPLIAGDKPNGKKLLTIFSTEIAAALMAFLMLSFLYFPIIESFQHVDAVSMYNARKFYHASSSSLLSLFTSKHFWEEYQAIPAILSSNALQNHGIMVTNSVYHFGAAAWLAAICCLMTGKPLRLVAITCIFFLCLSLGRIFGLPPINNIIELTPGFRSLGEQYWFISTAIAFTIASALGLEAIKESNKNLWAPAAAIFLTILGAAGFLYSRYGFNAPDIEYKQFCVCMLLLFAGLAMGLITLSQYSRKLAMLCCLSLCLVIACELVFDTMFYRRVKTEYFGNPPLAVQFLKKNCGLWRVVNLNQGALPAEEGSAFGIQQVETLNMNILPHYESFFHKHFVTNRVRNWGRFCTLFAMVESDDPNWKVCLNLPMLNLCGVKYIAVSPSWPKTIEALKNYGCKVVFIFPPWQIFENPKAYPRAFLATSISNLNGLGENEDDRARSVAFSQDARLIEDCKRLNIPLAPAATETRADHASAAITEYHNDKVRIKSNSEKPAVLILTDNWHPNWRARMDGEPVHIGLVDETFRAVAVPAGSHEIEMTYQPQSLPIGIALSALSLLIAALIFTASKRIDAWLFRF